MTAVAQPKPVAVPAPKPEYEMPPIRLGEIVYWYHGGQPSDEPMPAIVTRVGSRSVNLGIFHQDSYTLRCQDGVRHVSDPGIKEVERREAGAWSHTPAQVEILHLKAQIAELQDLVTHPKK